MSLQSMNRKVHYWASFIVAVPVLVIVCSGLLLQMKKQWAWVQPVEHRGSGTTPVIDLEGILTSVRTSSELAVEGWHDVNRVDVRPGRGVGKVSLNNGWEVQVDLGTGRVMQTAYRRSDVIEAIHDGSFFGGNWLKLGVFLPAGLVLLLLWGTGMWLWWVPLVTKRRRAARAALAKLHPGEGVVR